MNELNKEIVIRGIKIVDIVFIITVFFIFGYSIGLWIDNLFIKLFPNVKYNDKKTKWELIFEVVCQMIIIGVVSYIGRNLVELIPFPFQGVLGYDHMRVKELKTGALLTVFLVMFSYNMQDKLQKLRGMTVSSRHF